MRNSRLQSSIRARVLLTLLLVSPTLVFLQACGDLEEHPVSAITPENFYRNEQEVIGGLASVYADLHGGTYDNNGVLWAYYNLSEVSTDEIIVPTRGQDWYDNGSWVEIYRQKWGPNTASGLNDVNAAWVNSFRGVAKANILIDALTKVSVPNQKTIVAETRTLRAFYYYLLMDMFGGVPIVTTTEIAARPRATRAEVFKFIEDELTAAKADLPDRWPPEWNGRVTKGAADAILASMYLNAEVFTGTVTAAGLQKGAARWQDAVNAADRILNSGFYSLATNWRSNFTADNSTSPEIIFAAKSGNEEALGLNFIQRALHYSQFTPSPWNGFSTLAETYNAFDKADKRIQIFLVGCQVNVETGAPVKDRQDKPLCFTPEIKDITQASEAEGVRIMKWPPDPNHVGPANGNDYAFFRLGEIYLIKAEALNELGNTNGAVLAVNNLRARVFDPPKPLVGAFTQATFREQLLKERLFELTAEAKRRQDMIRIGATTGQQLYTAKRAHKELREPYRILFPIPQRQLDTNPQLTQNAGY